ncbi:AMP-binding protein, partial [Paraburkholderia sp. RP-4-7]
MSAIESVLQERRVFPPSAEAAAGATISGMDAYRALAAEAERDYEGFWGRLARETLSWNTPFTKVLDESKAPFYTWFEDGQLNASYNSIDRHVEAGNGERVAIIFEADDGTVTNVTYNDLLQRVSRFANALKKRGVKKGDRVVIYMPMSIEGIVAMQACARIGATHSVVFGGFSSKSLNERLVDVGAVALVTSDEQMRGGKALPLKNIADEAIAMGGCDAVKSVIVYKRTGGKIAWDDSRDLWMHELTQAESDQCAPEWVGAEHPLFILYTSGSTGKPKGVQHSTGGYLLWAAQTLKWTFDWKPTDVFWCTADIGWIT